MARRKEVFQSKVLQKLYPVTPDVEKEPRPSHTVDTVAKKACVKRKAPKEDPAIGDAAKTQSAVEPGRRMYTVLPPPAGYKTDSEKSVTPLLVENINSSEDPAGESVHDSDEEDDKEEEQGQSRKRRRRKKKKNLRQDSGKDAAAAVGESGAGRSQAAAGEGGERLSRNKKRKLKKKRHKEKLLSMGLVPRAAALEFTYKKDGEGEKGKEEEEEEKEEEEKKEDNERRAAEVSDFLRTTMEIYTSDPLMRVDRRVALSATLDDLLSDIDSGRKPSSVLKQLYALKAFVRQRKTDELEKALEELRNTSTMSPEEATAVILLFRYWITDVLPARGDTTTGLSATHL